MCVLVCQKQVSRAGTSNYIPQILKDAITCPCPWYLLLRDREPAITTRRYYRTKWLVPALDTCFWYRSPQMSWLYVTRSWFAYGHAHDYVIKWKHFPRDLTFLQGIQWSPMNSPHKGQWCGALVFSLICACINDWVNNRKAGDFRRQRAHYDVIVMWCHILSWCVTMKDVAGVCLTLAQISLYIVQCWLFMWYGPYFWHAEVWRGNFVQYRSGQITSRNR